MGPAPAVAAVRSAVRSALTPLRPPAQRVVPQDGQADPWPGNDAPVRVLVACSGGADSLALAAATAFEARAAGLAAGLVTVDHGLGPGSAEQARTVAALGYELGLDPVEIVRVDVGSTGGPEAAARDARYAALDAAAGALNAYVLLGHTLDDQAETVLLGLGRGSGPRSIAGMPAADGRYRRPFLTLRRATTAAACAALGLPVWQDPHNADPAFTRVRLRREVLPLLEDVLHGGVAPALARTAELLADDLAALDAWAAAVLPTVMISVGARESACSDRDHHEKCGDGDGYGDVDVAALVDLPRAVRTRVLRAWATPPGTPPLSAERSAALDALVTGWHGQGAVELPGRRTVRRESARLVLSAAPAAEHRSDSLQE